MQFTQFKDRLPPDDRLLLVADPFERKLSFGYVRDGDLFVSAAWRDGHCVHACGCSLKKIWLHRSPYIAWMLIGRVQIREKKNKDLTIDMGELDGTL